MCIKALVAARGGMVGETPTDESQDTMDEGTYIHEGDVLERRLPSKGFYVSDEQMQVELPVDDCVIRGHLDAVVTDVTTDESWVCEVKSMSDNVYRNWLRNRWEAQPGYAWQLSIYMHHLQKPGLVAAKNRNNGALNLFFVDEPPVSLDRINFKVRSVETLHGLGQSPGCDSETPWLCRYKVLHRDGFYTERGDTVILGSDMEALLSKYYKARENESDARAAREILREQILSHLSLAGAGKAETSGFRVSVRTTHTKRLDTTEARKLLGPLAEEVSTTQDTQYLSVERKRS